MMSLSAKLMHHQSCCLWSASWQLLIAYIIGNAIALKDTESIVTLKYWNPPGRKFSRNSRAQWLGKREMGGSESTMISTPLY